MSVGPLVRPSVILSDFHCVGVFGPSLSARGPLDVIFFLKAVTKNYLSVGVEGVLACLMQRLVWSLLLICTYHWQKPPVIKVPLNVEG